MNTLLMCGGPYGANASNTTCILEMAVPHIGDSTSTVSASNYLLSVMFLEEALIASKANEGSFWAKLVLGSYAHAINRHPAPCLPGGYVGQELVEVTWLYNAQSPVSKSSRIVISGGY